MVALLNRAQNTVVVIIGIPIKAPLILETPKPYISIYPLYAYRTLYNSSKGTPIWGTPYVEIASATHRLKARVQDFGLVVLGGSYGGRAGAEILNPKAKGNGLGLRV